MFSQLKSFIVKIGVIILIIVFGNKFFITTDLSLKIMSIAGTSFFIIIACYLFFGIKIKSSLPQYYVENKYFPKLSITAFITLESYLLLLVFSLGVFTDDALAQGGFKYFLFLFIFIFSGISIAGTILIVKYISRIKNLGTCKKQRMGDRPRLNE